MAASPYMTSSAQHLYHIDQKAHLYLCSFPYIKLQFSAHH